MRPVIDKVPASIVAKLWAAVCSAIVVSSACLASAQDSRLDQELVRQSAVGNAKEVARLLAEGANPNATRQGGSTALHGAARGGHLETMKALIDAGADINAVPKNGRSVLAEAAARENPDAVSLLLRAGANPDEEALGIAAWLNRTQTVKVLLDEGVEPDAGLGRAAQGGHVDLVRLLLKAGANPNAESEGGHSPLHLAALQGGIETVELLLANQADPNAVDDQGQTPLHAAIAGDADIRIVKRLVEGGARLDVADNDGVTPVRRASIGGKEAIYKWLVQSNGGREPLPADSKSANQETRSIEDLIADVSSNDRQQRQAARKKLVLVGKEAVPAIVAAIEAGADIEPFYEVFSNMGPAAQGALPLLTSRLNDKEQVLPAILTMHRMRPDIIDALDEQTKRKAAATLYDFIVDPKADVMAGFAFRMLMVLGEPAEGAIVRLLEHPAAQIRKQSARNLRNSSFTTQRLADALLHLAQADPDLEVRAAAASALQAMDRHLAAARKALMSVIRQAPVARPDPIDEPARRAFDAHRRGIEAAAYALGAFGVDTIDDLIPLLSPMERPQRPAAIIALASIGQAAVPRLTELVGHEDAAVSAAAKVALDRIGRSAGAGQSGRAKSSSGSLNVPPAPK